MYNFIIHIMSLLKVATNINIDLEFTTAPFHKRLIAWSIDFILFFIYGYLVFKVFDQIPNIYKNEDFNWILLIAFLPIALYPVFTESFMQGQTIGKRIMHIKVINETGGNATISQFIIRWMLKISDFIMLTMLVLLMVYGMQIIKPFFFVTVLAITDVCCIAFTKKGQRIGDIAAGTLLISTKNKGSLNETVFMDIEDNYVATYPAVMQLSDRDINMIKRIFDESNKKYNEQLIERTAQKVQIALKVQSKHDSMEFLEVLLKDYNHLSTN